MSTPPPASIPLRDAVPDDLEWLVARHGDLYHRENGFDESFGRLVREVLVAYFQNRDPSVERAWIPVQDGARLGSLFCVRGAAPQEAKLRLFWLEPEMRGTGLARRMLDACVRFARARGYREIALWTHESHVAAGRLYARSGFEMTQTRAVRNFGQDLVEQAWRRRL